MSDFTLTTQLRALPRESMIKSSRPTMTIVCAKGGVTLRLNRPAVREIGLEDADSRLVSVLASTLLVGVQADDEGTHLVSARGDIKVHVMRDLFHLKDGERFVLPASMADGILTARLPDTLQTRINYRMRKV